MEESSEKPSFPRQQTQHNNRHDNQHDKKYGTSNLLLPAAVVLILVAGGSFAAGMQYQKSHQSDAKTTGAISRFGTGFGGGMGQRGMGGVFGQVTVVSASSITVTERRDNSSKTLSITSTTTITKDGSKASTSDIASGDEVIIRTSTSNASEASEIIINPTLRPSGVGPGFTQAPDDSGAGTQTN